MFPDKRVSFQTCYWLRVWTTLRVENENVENWWHGEKLNDMLIGNTNIK